MNTMPKLSEQAVGHIRHIGNLSRMLPGDWSGMGSDWWDIGEGAHQYELAFMTYTLGIVQHRYTPAYREFCQTTMAALIDKMMIPDIWLKWVNSSRGGKVVNPDQPMGSGWIDPIVKHNIMFKGHLLQMAAMYETLYRDGRYSKPDAFTFEFKSRTWGDGDQTFKYDLPSLARIIHQEYVDSNFEGVQCEPNRVYPMCNQHAVLGLLHFDQAHGTAYAAEVMPKFKAAWLRKGYTNFETGSHMRMRWVQQEKIFHSNEPWADGWTGIFMHAWNRDLIQSVYPRERETHLEKLLAGKEGARVCCAMVPSSAKIGFGMFTALASEVGDSDARERLLAYADRNFSPRWVEGAFYFPRCDDWEPDANGNSRGVDVLSGNALLPMSRINAGDGLWDLYNRPWTDKQRAAPYFADIDPMAAGVTQAWHDDESDALNLSLIPGPKKGTIAIAVHQLDRKQTYTVRRGDEAIGRLKWGTGAASDPVSWPADGPARIRVDATQPCALTIARAH